MKIAEIHRLTPLALSRQFVETDFISVVTLRILSVVSGVALCLGAVASCRQSTKESDYTEKEVREFLKVGMEASAISARFGEPISENAAADGTVVSIYHRPFSVRTTSAASPTYYFTGFSVLLRENKLVSWAPITGNTSDPN